MSQREPGPLFETNQKGLLGPLCPPKPCHGHAQMKMSLRVVVEARDSRKGSLDSRLILFEADVCLSEPMPGSGIVRVAVEHALEGGRRRVTWSCAHPMPEVYLVAARFTEYSRPAGAVTAYAFLRKPDRNLAARYLEATAQYLEMYRGLFGPYPYKQFALVENFWETGYGMPSFTLLGEKIIRFPFILHSSYPHEILHNWWGNSVFVAYEGGN